MDCSKSYFDESVGGSGAQVLFGWLPEERNTDANGNPWGWAGVQSLPRAVTLSSNGKKLYTYPIDAVRVVFPPPRVGRCFRSAMQGVCTLARGEGSPV